MTNPRKKNITTILAPVQDPRPSLREMKQLGDRLLRENDGYEPQSLVDEKFKLPKNVTSEGLAKLEEANTANSDAYYRCVQSAVNKIRKCHQLSLDTSYTTFRLSKYAQKLKETRAAEAAFIKARQEALLYQQKLDALAKSQTFVATVEQRMETIEI